MDTSSVTLLHREDTHRTLWSYVNGPIREYIAEVGLYQLASASTNRRDGEGGGEGGKARVPKTPLTDTETLSVSSEGENCPTVDDHR